MCMIGFVRRRIVLGGGQLACMLVEAAQKIEGIELVAWSEDPQSPIFHVPGVEVFQGPLGEVLQKANVEGWIAESEFIQSPELSAGEGTPRLELLQLLSNKAQQKALLDRLALPTAPWKKIDRLEDLPRTREWVLKQSTFGYDGKGNAFDPKGFERFWERSTQQGIEVYAEKKVDFVRELARVFVRDRDGHVEAYPLVETHQEKGVCHWVQGPVQASKKLWDESEHIGLQLLESLNYVGCFAIEFFEDQEGQLWVNELAPRVHNSAHYSMDLGPEFPSQFENQVRAAFGLPLRVVPALKSGEAFLMLNLLGPFDLKEELLLEEQPHWSEAQGVLHWYAKQKIRSGRKMGHLNFSGQIQREKLLKQGEQFWHNYLKSQS